MNNLVIVATLFVLLCTLGVSYSNKIPKFSHVNVTFTLRSDEVIFLRKIREAKVNFDEGKRSEVIKEIYPVVQEFIVEENSIPDFEDMVTRLLLPRTDYSKARNEYVILFLAAKDNELQQKLIEVGISLRELKLEVSSGDLKAYIVEVSLIPQIETIASKIGMPNINYDKKRLSHMSVTFAKREDETLLHERLRKLNLHVEEIYMSEHEKWDLEYSQGKYVVDYFLEPHLFEDFAYALGVTLIDNI